MPRKSLPTYRRQKVKNGHDRAFIELNGRRLWLGRYGTDESHQRYAQLIAEWQASGCRHIQSPADLTILELIDAYIDHADVYYRRADGTPTGEAEIIKLALKPLNELYSLTRVAEFGPLALKAVRQRMIELKWTRVSINKQVVRIRSMFKWAVSQQMIPTETYVALSTMQPLKAGRSSARKSEPVRPVPEQFVGAIRPFVSRQVWAMVHHWQSVATPSECRR